MKKIKSTEMIFRDSGFFALFFDGRGSGFPLEEKTLPYHLELDRRSGPSQRPTEAASKLTRMKER